MMSGPVDEVDDPPKPFCNCWDWHTDQDSKHPECKCGEQIELHPWCWKLPVDGVPAWVVIAPDMKEVTFHPFYSSGTALVKSDTLLEHNYHYYWEIKMLSDPYGTDIMIGVGSGKVVLGDSVYHFGSFLGHNEESYGLSYTGAMCHDATIYQDCPGFCKGTIIGVRVDLFQGTLEFYLNREPQGIVFRGLRRHEQLFPMLCSTAASSSMRLINATSWKASLLVDAAKVLSYSAKAEEYLENSPPGLRNTLQSLFWMTLQSKPGYLTVEDMDKISCNCGLTRKHWRRRW